MTTFSNIKQAVDYHPTCPICNSSLSISNSGVMYDIHDKNIIRILMPESANEYSNYILYLDIITSQIKNEYKFSASYNGLYYQGLTLCCNHCNKFHYVLKLIIDIDKKTVSEIVLNSESVFIRDENGVANRIRNTYYDNTTTYEINFRTIINVPMISINFNNTTETFERLKNLIIFS